MEWGLALPSPGSSLLKEECRKDYTGTVAGKVNVADSLSLTLFRKMSSLFFFL